MGADPIILPGIELTTARMGFTSAHQLLGRLLGRSPAGAPAENLDCLPWPILRDVPWAWIFESSAQGMDKNPAVLFRGFLLS